MTVQAAYQAYFPRIREKCRRMLGDAGEAEDVAQETFVRLWQAGLPSGPPERVMAWVYRTSTRLAIDRMRRRQVRREELGAAALSEAVDPACLESQVGRRDALLRLAAQLPADELEVVLLHRLDRLTQPEIAEVAKVSERTVRRLLQRFEQRVQPLKQGLAR
ncbi:MAG TPA: RNA polymerase sigma factor [Aggregicoccus sp.]|nr:RNA polymerase sigma factor [Aggregicoccus sp.]